jgi:hypothetical protein
MQTKTIDVTASSGAPAEAVWALLADVKTWSTWAGFDLAELERPGAPEPQGVGALRRFRSGRVRNLEEVVRFEAPRVFSYEVRRSPIPMRGYHADVVLSDAPDGGTLISWRSRFQAPRPLAALIEKRLRAFIADTAERLAAAAERPAR